MSESQIFDLRHRPMLHFARVPHWTATTLDVLRALLTPVIAAIAAYIAYQQYRLNKRKVEFDRYERRIQIYREVRAVLIRVQRDFKPEIAELQNFITATAEADFLYGPEIPAYRRNRQTRLGSSLGPR